MPVLIACPACAAKLKVSEELAASGKNIKCSKCGEKFALGEAHASALAATSGKEETPSGLLPPKKSPPPPPTREGAEEEDSRGAATTVAKTAAKRPAPSPEHEPVDSTLLREQAWMLRRKQHIFFANMFRERYDFFHPESQESLGFVKEKRPLWASFFYGFRKLRPYLPSKFDVRDKEGGPVLMTLRTSGNGAVKRIAVHDAQGVLLWKVAFDRYKAVKSFALKGPNDETVALFRQGKGMGTGLYSPDEQEWGRVIGEQELEAVERAKAGKRGAVKFLPKAPGLFIQMNASCADQTMAKILLLSVAITLRICGLVTTFAVKA